MSEFTDIDINILIKENEILIKKMKNYLKNKNKSYSLIFKINSIKIKSIFDFI